MCVYYVLTILFLFQHYVVISGMTVALVKFHCQATVLYSYSRKKILFIKSNQLLTIYCNTFISEIYNRIKIVNLADMEVFDYFFPTARTFRPTQPERLINF